MTKILVVDDIGENRYMLSSLLKGNGYEVEEAVNGAEALALAQSSPPDLIVTDIMMPVIDGFELCRRWKRDEHLRSIPFLIYTATYTDPTDERLALNLGADRFLIKPQKLETIMQVVRELLEGPLRDPSTLPAVPTSDKNELLHQHRDTVLRKLEKKVLELNSEIARRTKVEQDLKEGARLLRIAGGMARLGGWSVDLKEMRASWSDDVAAIHEMPAGHSPSVEEGMSFYATEWRARIEEVFHACARDGTSYDEEMEIVTATGKRVWVRTIGEAIRDTSGNITKVQGALQDITDRKRADEERQILQKQLLQAQKLESIGRLAGGVAHDFNNLLCVVFSHAELAISSLYEGDPLAHNLEEIMKAGERSATLVSQLLAFSRNQILQPVVLNLSDVVTDIEDMLRRLLGENIDIESSLDDNLGGTMADPGQIEQVIMNLAINARDAMPNGGKLIIETANVELDEDYEEKHLLAKPGSFVMLSMTDTGTGMDEAIREHIYEPFFTTKEKGKGTGLGLSTVYGIVKQSGGSICAHSKPERGTTFKVYLPRVNAPAIAAKRKSIPTLSTGNETVLIVEDDEAVRRIAERILQSAGYTVLAAPGGHEALLLSEKHDGVIDLLLTDIVMPQMSGQKLAARLAKASPRLKVLFMSGYAGDAVVNNDGLNVGTPILEKPFAVTELTFSVREVLDES